MKIKFLLSVQIVLLIILSGVSYALTGTKLNYKIIESSSDKIRLEFNFAGSYEVADTVINGKALNFIKGKTPLNGWESIFLFEPGKPLLPQQSVSFGVPIDSKPQLKIISADKEIFKNKLIIPVPEVDPETGKTISDLFDQEVYNSNKNYPSGAADLSESFFMRYIRVNSVNISPFQFNPVTRELIFYKKIVVEINYKSLNTGRGIPVNDPTTIDFIKSNLINSSAALNMAAKQGNTESLKQPGNYWYNPDKNYFKIFLKNEGVYRVSYKYLALAGVPLFNVPIQNLELINYGEHVPLKIEDTDSNGIFNQGDYFEFVGKPIRPTPYAKLNIYNLSNVYWFSYQGDSLSGSFYKIKNSFPENFQYVSQTSLNTVRYEKDQIYERLGYAPDEQRDYWFWGKASAQGGAATQRFDERFTGFSNLVADSHYVTLRVNMHGMTNSSFCSVDHDAYVYVNGKLIGNIQWDGQTEITFERKFYVGADSVPIYPGENSILVEVNGNTCPPDNSDEIRINWFELDYWRFNRAVETYSFKSDFGVTGKTSFWVWQWLTDSVNIFIPQKQEILKNYAFDETYRATVFLDSVTEQTEYFLIAQNVIPPSPDSISKDAASDLRNTSNEADYIILTHPDFMSAANRLADFRRNNFPDTTITNPRIKIVDVLQVYDEFSYGMLDPYALQYFMKYAFENWQQPAPSYLVLLGDMSWDYRHILPASRPNFIPSIPVHVTVLGSSLVYGQAVSDNSIVMVSGTDNVPDLAIGRLSCETMDEANTLIDKIMSYPGDNSKEWRQNVMLVSSGQNFADENLLGFNDANIYLEQSSIVPLGAVAKKIFRFPNRPEYNQFQGDGPEIRKAFDDGAVMANYYGHGGGSQWDLVFLNDDIYLLNNGSRLPFVLSTTCYTAHFDNQDVFGEKFVKVPGKGAISFIGSSGLTLWWTGKYFNELVYNQVFNNRVYNIGKAILNAGGKFGTGLEYEKQLAVFTYLGDPVLKLALPESADFLVSSSDISITPENPLVKDTVNVKVKIRNMGIVFSDSVSVQLFATSTDTTYLIGVNKMGSFGEYDSTTFTWAPASGGLYELQVKINENGDIPEPDHSDNIASASFAVFNLSEPNILFPEKGFSTNLPQIDFTFSDIGYYVGKNLLYSIEVDTSTKFSSPIISSGSITPADGLVKWKSPQIQNGEYFWRARIFDGENYSNWSPVSGVIITPNPEKGYTAKGKLLQLYDTYNINYVPGSGSLVLNKELLPPHPDNTRFIEDIIFPLDSIENLGLTTITTDGTYIYFANIWYYSLFNNPGGFTKIHKVGTGNNGTVKGHYYGTIPDFYDKIINQMFYHKDGFIYAATGEAHRLLKINPQTGDTSSVNISTGLLENEAGRVQNGAFYITSDGKYVYNLTLRDSLGNKKYVLRTFDPANNWAMAKADVVFTGTSYYGDFTGFFVADDYLYPLEYFNSNLIRRIRLSDGLFEEEWIIKSPFQSYYATCYDWTHNEIYASVFRSSGFFPKFTKFIGSYTDDSGNISSEIIGPVFKWNSLSYVVENGNLNDNYTVSLKGLNKVTRNWDILNDDVSPAFSMANILASTYPFVQLEFKFTNSSSGSDPVGLKSLSVNYESLPEITISNKDFSFNPDSVLQGLNTIMNLNVRNLGKTDVDSLQVKFYLNNADSSFYSTKVKVVKDNSTLISYPIPTSTLLFKNTIKALTFTTLPEFFTYNNIAQQSFYVARDSIKPEFNITFDGNEIINGDIVSANPEVLITLKDNSPLPLDTSYFTLVHNNVPLIFAREDIKYSYTSYPNSQFTIKWTPKLEDGKHTIEVLAKDASNNFFDTTSSRTDFFVYNKNSLDNVYNYPNPFEDNTYFTFEIRGTEIPDQFLIKVYTIAGRLIRNITTPVSELKIGFNKVFWDGRDEDGDNIANGLYLYKIISTLNGQVLTKTEKIVKMK